MKDFRKLKVWEKSHALTLNVYRATQLFPKDERFGLVDQARRACASIPANIAEGCERSGDAELGRFLQIAMGSASELEYHLLLAKDLGYLSTDDHSSLTHDLVEVKQMLASLIKTVKAGHVQEAVADRQPLTADRS